MSRKGKWGNLSKEQRLALLARKQAGENPAVLAEEIGMYPITLARRLQELQKKVNKDTSVVEVVKQPEKPKHSDLFTQLKRGFVSLDSLSRKYDRSEYTILEWINELRDAGYNVVQKNDWVQVDTVNFPKAVMPAKTLADQEGHEVIFGVASDIHAGSRHSQPSALNKFIQIAENEYGVKHFLVPGDLTCGVYGYRGQHYDQIPLATPSTRDTAWLAVNHQARIASRYFGQPKNGRTYYVLGGNHDAFSINATGVDPVRVLTNSRSDMYYVGYDAADIPLTDRVNIRMVHPSGGVPYALSYRLQKNMESVAYQELASAIVDHTDAKMRILLLGHLHVQAYIMQGPVVGAQCSCFEGQTSYLKRKGLTPHIGGQIFKVRVTDGGLIQRVEYIVVPFHEVEDDWKNFDDIEDVEQSFKPDKLEQMFKIEE